MSAPQSIHDIIEDHALERVPDGERRGWLAMSWNTVGIVTTLVQIYVGALITFIAGMKIALLSGVIVALIGGTISFLVILSVLTISFSGIMLADYFIVRRQLKFDGSSPGSIRQVNWSGVITIISSFILSHYILNTIIPVEFITAIIVSSLLYPLLYRVFYQDRQS